MVRRTVGAFSVLAVVLSLFVLQPATPASAEGGGTVDLTGALPATFTVTPGVEQLTVRGAAPRAPLTLVHADSLERIITLYTDDAGQLVFQYVPDDFLVHDPQVDGVLPTVNGSSVTPGSYRVVSEGVPGEPFDGDLEASDPFDVLAIDDVPDPSLYDQELPFVSNSGIDGVQPGSTDEDGYGYLETRDGTLLAVNVRLPDPTIYGPGPYPTVVQYSGYAPARPGMPAGADAGGMLAGILGYAYVGVNIRGSGCSGGTFDAFNAAQAADGYDVIETVARQPWVKNGRPAMAGISFSGITQLYVAATNPPSLAAITPLSVIEDPWYQQWPGGIYNAGFTREWLAQRDDEADGGAQWVKDRIDGGDTTCASNLEIRSQGIPFAEFAQSLVRRPVQANDRNLSLLAREIDVPVFLAGAWQDEQTGARFGLLLDDFTSLPPGQAKFTVYNGQHDDAFSPLVMSRWFEFLAFYVDTEVPKINPVVRAGAPLVFEDVFGFPGLSFEQDRFLEPDGVTPIHGSYEGAVAAYEAEDPVRVLMEVGASPDFPDHPRAPRQRYTMELPSWPPPSATPRTFYLGADGTLADQAPGAMGIDRFEFDPDVLDEGYNPNAPIGDPNGWKPTPDGKGLAYETAPLTEDVILTGEGYLDLWFRSTGTDAPLEIVLSEVYATDGEPTEGVPTGAEEVRVQHGLLQAGYRTLDPDRTEGTQIDHLFYAEDYEPLTPGQFVNLQIPLYSAAHPFRAGSKLRIEINTPGGDAHRWDFVSDDFGATTHDVAHGGAMASKLVLPTLPNDEPDTAIPTEFAPQSARPDCGSLRAQPCRAHHELTNQTVHVTPACEPAPFDDVDGTNPFCGDIAWMAAEGLSTGEPDGTFRPGSSVTRQALAAFLYRRAGSPNGPDPVCEEAAFTDVPVEHVFCGEIAWMKAEGLALGEPDGSYRPTSAVTRQATTAFLFRLSGPSLGDAPACTEAAFTDVPVEHPFCREIAWAAGAGITTGRPDGSFGPSASVTRQAFAAFLQRYQILTV